MFSWCNAYLSSVYHLGWGLLTTVAALSCVRVFRLQQLFCEFSHGQKTSEDQQGRPRCLSSSHLWLIELMLPCFHIYLLGIYSHLHPPQPSSPWFKHQTSKHCQPRGPSRLGPRSPSSQNPWLQLCPWLMPKLPYKPRLLSSNPCRQPCFLWLNQPRSTSSQRPLQVRHRITTPTDTHNAYALWTRGIQHVSYITQ